MRGALTTWLGVIVVLFAGCVAGDLDDGEAGGAAEALTYSNPTTDHPYVGFLETTRSGVRERCGASLIGRRTIVTAAHCIDGSLSSARFLLSANGRWYDAVDPLIPSGWPRFDRVAVDFGYGAVYVDVTVNDIGIMRLTTMPDLTISRGSLTDYVPDEEPRMPYKALGVASNGDVRETEHDHIGMVLPTSIWFGDDNVGFGRGGIAEAGDYGAPTVGRVSTGIFGTGGEVEVISGIHAMKIARGPRIPWDVMVDTRIDAWVGPMADAANGDLCVDGRHDADDGQVRCAGGSGADAACGNGVVEGTEECDDENTGSGDGCSSLCREEGGWACRGEPSLCVEDDGRAVCGNGLLEGAEECDDDNTRNDDGCDSRCREQSGWICDRSEPTECTPDEDCGDGRIDGTEECDDGNQFSSDGCDRSCRVEPGWRCDRFEPSRCMEDDLARCGDAFVDGGEQCDDGNRTGGDGCDGSCREEDGWRCTGDPSHCERESQSACGDGIVDASEQCDDGNEGHGDGCSADCRIESGWTCRRGQPSECMQDDFVPPSSGGSSSGSQCAIGLPEGSERGGSAWLVGAAAALLCLGRRRLRLRRRRRHSRSSGCDKQGLVISGSGHGTSNVSSYH